MEATTKNLDETIAFWQPQVSRPLCHEDARQMAGNIAGFFQTLAAWDLVRGQSSEESDLLE